MEANNKKSNKKQLILHVLNLLNTHDENDPITQIKITEHISDVYPCDRKTVCRNIKFLKEMGYPIKKNSKGFYIEKIFSVEDVNFIKAAIMAAAGKEEAEKTALAEKVSEALNKMYRR